MRQHTNDDEPLTVLSCPVYARRPGRGGVDEAKRSNEPSEPEVLVLHVACSLLLEAKRKPLAYSTVQTTKQTKTVVPGPDKKPEDPGGRQHKKRRAANGWTGTLSENRNRPELDIT